MRAQRIVTTVVVATGLLAASVTAPMPRAEAASKVVAVKLRVRIGQVEAGYTMKDCVVPVATRSSGMAVLKAARARGCVESYKLRRDRLGVLASCVNDVCEVWPQEVRSPVYAAWDIYFPGEPHWNQRLDRFRAGPVMRVLQLHYVALVG